MRRTLPVLALLLAIACQGESTPATTVASVAVTPATLDLAPGGSAQLTATPRSSTGEVLTTPVTWSSAAEAVATVSSTGLVSAIAAGSAVITATSGGVRGTASVVVTPVPVAAVVVTPATLTLETGDTTRLRASTRSAAGSEVTGRSVNWTSAEPAIASVSLTGLATGVATGTTTISAVSEGKVGTASVTVVPAAVSSVALTPITPTLIVGQTRQLTASVRDARGGTLTGRPVTWTSSDASTLTVSGTGLLTAVRVGGPVTISASSEGKQATLAMTVVPVPVARIAIATPSAEVNENATVQLTATATDSAGGTVAGRTFTWVSDSSAIATVDANGLVRALRTGTVRIRARADNAEATVTLVVRGLIHRWTFDEVGGPGTTFRDDVRGRSATLVRVGSQGGSAVGGQVTLTGGARALAT